MKEALTGLLVEDATWIAIRERLRVGVTGILPVGAACKEHGGHLPMATDRMQADWLGRSLAAKADVVVWPTLTYGYYPAFARYPGSISLERETFIRLARDVVSGILASGARRLLIVNTGISTIGPLKEAVQFADDQGRLILANVYEGPRFRRAAQELEQQRCGSHADEIETSIMLVIAGERVRMDRAVAWDAHRLQGAFSPDDPMSPGYSPSGVYGDPTRASADKGKRLLAAMLADVLSQLNGWQPLSQ